MAFRVVQRFDFQKVRYSYDRTGDVLYVSFGPPVPAVAIQVEDWLALRVSLRPPSFVGMTIVGFKRIFERINRYIEQELPERVQRLSRTSISISYEDGTDTLIMRFKEPGLLRKPSIFEPLAPSVYVEKSLPSKDIVGIKIVEYTKMGPAAIEAFFEKILETVFEPHVEHDENAHLVTNVLIGRLNWKALAALAG